MLHQETLNLSVARDMFLLDCEARRLSPTTRDFYRRKLRIFLKWLAGDDITALECLTAHHIRTFLVSIEERGLTSQYQHNLARAIKAFLNFCVRDEILERSPFEKVRMPRIERKLPETITSDDITRILQVCTCERDRAICLFLLDSGVRSGELVALNVGDVDLRSGTVTVRLGKGRKGRTTYIGKATRKQLKSYLAQRKKVANQDALFLTEKGVITAHEETRMTQWGLTQLMERLRRRSGVLTCRCHSFRRTFALNCLRNGMNIYVLAKLMGHADITVLRHYLALVEEDLHLAHARFGAVDHMGFRFQELGDIKNKHDSAKPQAGERKSAGPRKARGPSPAYVATRRLAIGREEK